MEEFNYLVDTRHLTTDDEQVWGGWREPCPDGLFLSCLCNWDRLHISFWAGLNINSYMRKYFQDKDSMRRFVVRIPTIVTRDLRARVL